MQRFAASYVLVDGEFRRDHAISVRNGEIVDVGPVTVGSTIEHLGDVALIPGLVNAHSHAFQRAIRGRTEKIDPAHPDDDFWTWRDQMYRVMAQLGPDEIYAVSRWTFLEMLLSGITTVGEFHYVHHQPDGTPYDDPNELAHRVIAAARDVGIRIALLRVAYRRGGHRRDIAPEQRRFVDDDDETLLARVDALRSGYAEDPLVTFGLAPHSIRAVDRDTLIAASGAARAWDLPLHIHACEQRREIEESIAEYGLRPIEVFEELGMLDDRLTLVHATHLSDAELDLLASRRPTVCACPTTERNLGDGFLPAAELVRRRVPIALGSDSHTNIDLWEDARCVEYHERLRAERRNVLAGAAGTATTAEVVWPMLAQHGARALRLPVGALEVGRRADFVALDLNHPTLVGADEHSLLADICLSMTPDAVRDVWVDGKPVVCDREHPLRVAAADAFRLRVKLAR